MVYSTIQYYDEYKKLLGTDTVINSLNNIDDLFLASQNAIRKLVCEKGYYHAEVLPMSKDGFFYFLVYECFVPKIHKISFLNLNSQLSNNNIIELNKYKSSVRDLITSIGLEEKYHNRIIDSIKRFLGNYCLYIDVIGFNINHRSSIKKHVDIELYSNIIMSNLVNIEYVIYSDLEFINIFLMNFLRREKVSSHNVILDVAAFLYNKFDFIHKVSIFHYFDNNSAMNSVKFIISSKYKFLLTSSFKPSLYFIGINNDKNFCLSTSNVKQICMYHVNSFGNFNWKFGHVGNVNNMTMGDIFPSPQSIKYINILHKHPLYSIDIELLNNIDFVFDKSQFIIKYLFFIYKSVFLKRGLLFNAGAGYSFFLLQNTDYLGTVSGSIPLLKELVGNRLNRGSIALDLNLNSTFDFGCYINRFRLGFSYGIFSDYIIPTKCMIPVSLYLIYGNDMFDLNLVFGKFVDGIESPNKSSLVTNILYDVKVRIGVFSFVMSNIFCKLKQVNSNNFFNLSSSINIRVFLNILNTLHKFYSIGLLDKFDVGITVYNLSDVRPYVDIFIKDFI